MRGNNIDKDGVGVGVGEGGGWNTKCRYGGLGGGIPRDFFLNIINSKVGMVLRASLRPIMRR